jgi:epoxyqueuosine reductase
MTLPQKHATIVKQISAKLGFDFCGISEAKFLEEEAPRLESWLNRNYHGQMGYLAHHFDKRLDPRKLVDGAKSVVSLAYNYFPKQVLDQSQDALKLAKYAYGKDYHFVVKEKLIEFLHQLREEIGDIGGRVFVDSAPVMERQWAQQAGLGWIGKNSLLINRSRGSFFFLAELILDLDLAPDSPITKDYCGTCTKCIDACPTDAIVASGVVDGSKCISFFTIELKDELPTSMKGQFENWIFGCDICQDVCPWNRFSVAHHEPDFEPHPELATFSRKDWEELTEETFAKVFQKSAVKRTKYKGLMRNIGFLKK